MSALMEHRLRYVRWEQDVPMASDVALGEPASANANNRSDAVRIRINVRNREGCFMNWAEMTPNEADALAAELADSAKLVREQTASQ